MADKLLTPLELKVMNLLWKRKSAFVKDLINDWPDSPVPKYNTVSTIVRILVEKGYVGYKAIGRGHEYHPMISKTKFQQSFISHALENVFSGSMSGLLSSLLSGQNLSAEEIERIQSEIDQQKSE